MRAAWYERNGPAREVLRVGELPTPQPGPGEVRVRLRASGVNPSDVKSRQGLRAPMAYPRIVPHSDGAGVIDAVGPGVPEDRIGERVWVWNAQWRRPFGTAATHVALPSAQAVRLPDGADFAAGACWGIPALTAHRCVFADGPVAGRTVLVTGGAGSVGHYAVQFAKWGGARVIATASGEEKAALARAAGADHVLNHRREDVAAAVLELTGGAGVERIVEVEFGGNLPATERMVAPHGTVAAYASMAEPTPKLPFYALMFRNVTIRTVFVYELPEDARRQAIADLTAAEEAGALVHDLGPRFPLDRVADAHEAVESGTTVGNVVVEID